jgi:hypothetical protein
MTDADRATAKALQQRIEDAAVASARTNKLVNNILRIGGLLLVLYVGYYWITAEKGDTGATRKSGEQCHDATSAKIMAKQLVGKRLKAPSTAEWCNTARDFEARRDNGQWAVIGCVDSQNAFGAMIRTNFVATLECSPTGWTLVELSTH